MTATEQSFIVATNASFGIDFADPDDFPFVVQHV